MGKNFTKLVILFLQKYVGGLNVTTNFSTAHIETLE